MANLYIVGTPIGNLGDITLRALETLKSVDLILCEDTRMTKKLLSRYSISKEVKRLDAEIEGSVATNVKKLFDGRNSIALVSDAGTPTISDPGYRLVEAARKEGITVITIPGPSAIAAALSISGLPADEFLFLGFLPHKKGREKLFKEIVEAERTVVFYESPHRIMKTLERLSELLPEDRKVVIARELTKIHESVTLGSAREVKSHFEDHPDQVRGEFVVMVNLV